MIEYRFCCCWKLVCGEFNALVSPLQFIRLKQMLNCFGFVRLPARAKCEITIKKLPHTSGESFEIMDPFSALTSHPRNAQIKHHPSPRYAATLPPLSSTSSLPPPLPPAAPPTAAAATATAVRPEQPREFKTDEDQNQPLRDFSPAIRPVICFFLSHPL